MRYFSVFSVKSVVKKLIYLTVVLRKSVKVLLCEFVIKSNAEEHLNVFI